MKDDLANFSSERTQAITWLRGVLTAMLEISPLSYWQKKKSARLISQIPDWLVAAWADALNIDYVGGFKQYPDMAERAKSDTGRNLAQQYLEDHDAVPLANIIADLVSNVTKASEGGLPADRDTVARHVYAMALTGCVAGGADSAKNTKNILGNNESPDHPLVGYHLALMNGDKSKIEVLDAALAGVLGPERFVFTTWAYDFKHVTSSFSHQEPGLSVWFLEY